MSKLADKHVSKRADRVVIEIAGMNGEPGWRCRALEGAVWRCRGAYGVVEAVEGVTVYVAMAQKLDTNHVTTVDM